MSSFPTFDAADCGYALLSVFITVVVILLIRLYGKLPVTLFGVDLNLLSYGYLWETCLKAIRGHSYWPRLTSPSINKPLLLFVICLLNVLLLAWNMKILHNIETNVGTGTKIRYTNWFLRPVAIAFGFTGLVAFILFNSMWG